MNTEIFGAFIQSRRKELGLTQAELAEKLHVTAKAVSRWERGVGFPDIQLLQPLADALEITIAELMQSRRMEAQVAKETAAELVSDTVQTIREQQKQERKKIAILHTGNTCIAAVYIFLYLLGRNYDFQPRWIGLAVSLIGIFVWHYGSRALKCLVTGEPFFRKRRKPTKGEIAAYVIFCVGFFLIVAVLIWAKRGSDVRSMGAVFGLMAMLASGLYLYDGQEKNSWEI